VGHLERTGAGGACEARGKHEASHGEHNGGCDRDRNEQARGTLAALELAHQRVHMDFAGPQGGVEREIRSERRGLVEGKLGIVPPFAGKIVTFGFSQVVIAAIAGSGDRYARSMLDGEHERCQPRYPLLLEVQIVEAHGERPRVSDLHRSLQHVLDRIRKLLDAVMRLERLERLGRALQGLAQQRIGAIDGMPIEVFRHGRRVTRHTRNSLFCPRPRASHAPISPVKARSLRSNAPVVRIANSRRPFPLSRRISVRCLAAIR
jgi:hypothetical protein